MLYVDLELQLQTFFNVRENILTLATITHSSYFFFFFTFLMKVVAYLYSIGKKAVFFSTVSIY